MTRIGEMLVQEGLLSDEELDQVLAFQNRSVPPVKLGEAVVALQLMTELEMLEILSDRIGVPFVRLAREKIDPTALALLGREASLRRRVLPYRWENTGGHRRVVVAMTDPSDLSSIDALQFELGFPVIPVLTSAQQLADAIAALTTERSRRETVSGVEAVSIDTMPNYRPPARFNKPTLENYVVTLRVIDGPDKLYPVQLLEGQRLIFGRSTRADVSLDDPRLSRQHFMIEVDNNDVELTDLGSRNGTLVNKERIEKVLLQAGDTIIAGSTHLLVEMR
ncbi:MAG: FHA domain-containing protein [Myxococcota bacterium]